MKIKTKFLLGLSSKPVVVFILIISGIMQISSLKSLHEHIENNYERAFLAEQIQRDMKDEAISLRNLLIITDKDSLQNEQKLIQAESNSIIQHIAQLESNAITPEQKKRVKELTTTSDKFNVYRDKVLEFLANGDKAEAARLIDNNGHSIHDELFQVISKMTETYESQMKSSFTGLTEDMKMQIVISSLICLISVLISSGIIVRTVFTFTSRLRKVSSVMKDVASGKAKSNTMIETNSNDEIDDMARSFNFMIQSLEEQRSKEQDLIWIKSNIAQITTSLSGMTNLEALSQYFLSKVVPLMGSCNAAFYGKNLDEQLGELTYQLLASYAGDKGKKLKSSVALGEGLIGQAALEKLPITLSDVPADYITVKSGVGETQPLYLNVIPIIFEGDVLAVFEIASFKDFTSKQRTFLEEITKSVGIILESVNGRIRLAKLLEESQVLMEEVQAQSEELQTQQEELRVTNEELEEQTQALRQSEQVLQFQQEELEQTNSELKEKAAILEEQNKLFEQTNREVEKARSELEEKARQLTLSSKYKSEFLANMSHELRTPLNSLLILSKLLADNKDGNLTEKQVKYSKTIYSSGSDLLVLINDILDLAKIESGKMNVSPSKVKICDIVEFLENSFRPIANEKNLSFKIPLTDGLPDYIFSDEQKLQQVLTNLLSNAFKFTHKGGVILKIGPSPKPGYSFSFAVTDTGIGIPKDKQELIFEAFQQADGTTSRRYGGTGLGLSICREISNLLNGDIEVESEEGKGSKFTFYIAEIQEEPTLVEQFKSLDEVAATIETKVDIPEHQPKVSSETSGDENKSDIKRLLIVDDDLRQRNSLMELIGEKDIIINAVSTGAEALEELNHNNFDCMILDLGLSDANGFDLLEQIKFNAENNHLHVFIYTGRDLSPKEELYLMKYSNTIIIKDEHSPQRLLDELEMYLSSSSGITDFQNQSEFEQVKTETDLEGKRILLVDDDVRNVFALMSLLEQYQMDITFAENGKECLEILEKSSGFDLILMDIMMPEMDGYETMRRIREDYAFSNIPIIALTAKAMKEDRELCMNAGASDYIVKPFDSEQLISLIKVWLYQRKGN